MLDSITKAGITYHIERDRDYKDGDFFVGQRVYTDRHGYGVIQSVDACDSTDNAVKVKFDNETNLRPFYLNGRYTIRDSEVGNFDLRRLLRKGKESSDTRPRNRFPVRMLITNMDDNLMEVRLRATYEPLERDGSEVNAMYRGTLADMLEKARAISTGDERFTVGALVYSKLYGHGRVTDIMQSSPTDRYPVRVEFPQEGKNAGKYYTFDGRYWSSTQSHQDIELVCKNPDPAQLEALTTPVEEEYEWEDGMPVHCDDKGIGNIINIIDGLTAEHEGKSIVCQWDDGTCSIHNEEGFYLTNGCDEEGKRITPAI